MWIREVDRDRRKGVDSPMPALGFTEEFIPRQQTEQPEQVEPLIGQMAGEKSRRLGIDRRS